MTESTAGTQELSEQDKADLRSIGIDPDVEPTQRSLLTLWREVLGNVAEVGKQNVPINVAHKIVASWPFISFQETQDYHVFYHQVLAEARDRFDFVLKDKAEAFDFVGDDDAANNHEIYRDLLVTWHNMLDGLEAAWVAKDADAHIWVGVIADARAFFFSQLGFAGHLDSIGFQLSDDEFLAAVAASREEQGE